MSTVLFEYRGAVHNKMDPARQNINKEHYVSDMRRFHEAIRLKQPQVGEQLLASFSR